MLQLFVILLMVLLNGVLAMSEIAVVSATRSRLQTRADQKHEGAAVALQLKEDPNRFLSTVQIGITLVGIGAGAFGGTTLGRQLGDWLAGVTPLSTAYTEPLGIAGVVIFTTYLSLVLGELVPKRLAMQFPDAISANISIPMSRVSRLAAPVVWLLSQSTEGIIRLMGIDPDAEQPPTDAEVINMVEKGSSEGVFETNEVAMVRGVLELDEKYVSDIMTPRPDISSLSLHQPIDEMKEIITGSPHSFYPVCDGNVDNVIGIVKAKDLLAPLVSGESLEITRVMRPPLFIPGVTLASRALQIFKSSGIHVALVISEHGGVDGLLTLNNVIEEIVGDIDADESEAVQREDGSWLLDGRMPLARFDNVLPDVFDLPPGEARSYRTLAGFVMARLDRVPRIGDVFTYGGLRFEVVDMDAARIDRVMVSKVEPEVSDE